MRNFTKSLSFSLFSYCVFLISFFAITGCGQKTEEAAVVGDVFGGGIVFYILQPDDSGYVEGETHGLIASKQDIAYSDVYSGDPDTGDPSYSDSMRSEDNEEGFVRFFRWSTSNEDSTSPHYAHKSVPETSTALGTGAANTAGILAVYPKGIYKYSAAAMCDSYESEGYTDWYLSSKEELHMLYENRDAVGGFAVNVDVDYWSDFYWSSSEGSDGDAWSQNFVDGFQYNYYKDYFDRVRAVRAF